MYRILSFLLVLTALGFGFAACENPNSNDSGNFMDQPMAAKGGGGKGGDTAPADPKIVYMTKDGNFAVMDSTGENQTTVYTPATANIALEPNWSPSNSITWTERSGLTSTIRAADISVSNGTPVSSNIRTIASLTSTSPDYMSIRHARWSSLSSTNKIAFSLSASAAGTSDNHVCLVSASGGTWDTIYTTPHNTRIMGLAWDWRDSKLAVLLRREDANNTFLNNYFVIIDPGTGGGLPGDEIWRAAVSVEIPISNTPFDWSRATSQSNDINKIVFVSEGKIYYLTPGSGDTPTTNNVSWAMAGTVTWSPSNSHVMFVKSAGTKRNKSTGQWEETFDLYKNTAQTSTVTEIDGDFPHADAQLNWHR